MNDNPPERPNTIPNLEPDSGALELVCGKHGIRLIVLFGSHSRGFARPTSDVDLAFGFVPGRKLEYETLWEELIPLFHTDQLDLVDLGTVPPLLAWCAATTGKTLYDEDGRSWNLFRKRAVKEFEDVRHFDRWRLERIDRAIQRGRGS